jgi:hypothetical protein
MMRSSLLGSWIDVEAAAAAAETLYDPLPAVPSAGRLEHAEPAEESAWDRVCPAPPPQLRGRLQALRARAERNGLVAPPAAESPPPFAVPLGSLPVRVRALADWMYESFSPASLFVADAQGQPLVEFHGGASLLAAAAVLAEAAAKARRHLPGVEGAAMVHLVLSADQILSLVTAQTALGTWHAGLTTPRPLTEPAALELVHSLQAAAAGA